MANFLKKMREKKTTDPLRDVHMALMSLPTISIIFGTTAMIGDPLLSSLGSVASAVIALSGVVVGSRGVNNLVLGNNETYPAAQTDDNNNNKSESYGWAKSKLKKVGGVSNYQGSPLGGTASNSMSGDNNAKHLSREEQRMIQEEKDLAEAKKILEDSKESRENDFSKLFNDKKDSELVEEALVSTQSNSEQKSQDN